MSVLFYFCPHWTSEKFAEFYRHVNVENQRFSSMLGNVRISDTFRTLDTGHGHVRYLNPQFLLLLMESKNFNSEPQDLYGMSYIQLYNMKQVLHSPTLESVMMVEKTIQKYSQEYGKYQLWKKLPRKMMYQTFQAILDYLKSSGKIMIDRDGIIFWTYNPEMIRTLLSKGLKVR